MELDDAIRCAADGNGLLFVGAGLSFLASRENGRSVPDGKALIDLLLQQPIGTGSPHSLDRIAGAVVREKGSEFVYEILQDNFCVTSVDTKLKALYGLPWKRIYTTNYDNAAEIARSGTGPVSSVTLDDPQSSAAISSIVHLNGYIHRISPANINSGLLLTDASYAADRLTDSGWLSFFERDINTSRAIIFAGYSLYDLSIDNVLLSSEFISKKAFFFISPKADKIEISTLQRYGTVVPGGITALIEAIDDISKTYHPPRFNTGFTSLRELLLPSVTENKKPAAQLIVDQLVYGRLPEKEVLANEKVFRDQTYLVVRRQDKEAIAAIRQGPWRDILLLGEIASGKSASTLTLALYLISDGYRVFYAIKSTFLSAELLKLSSLDGKVAVIFDGYSVFRKEIEEYASRRSILHRIVMAERSAIHELVEDFVPKTPNLGPTYEIALDKIEAVDVAAFEALTNFGGFWGERAGTSVAARHRFISEELEGSLYRLLLEIIKSEKVQSKIRDLLKPILSDIPAARAFCSILLINSLGFEFTISEWQYLFDRQLIRRMLSTFAEQVRHFVLSDTDHIYLRNGLLSSHVVHAFMNDQLVRECLVDLYERSERRKNEDEEWKNISIELTKFSTVEPMFSGHLKSENIFSYYDAIRVFGRTENNPDYWLQLGIASTALDDLPRGKLCFDNAYARERARPRPNLTRIDNYFSRFEMRQAVAEPDANVAFKTFIKANERLERQIFLDTNRHYPFKTGRAFSEIASKHYSAWNKTQKERFKAAVESINQKARDWKSKRGNSNTDVELLIRETNVLLKRLN